MWEMWEKVQGAPKQVVGLQVEEMMVEQVYEAQMLTSCRETLVSTGCF